MRNNYPCIKICDIETSIKWYEDFLGFQCTYKSSISNPDSALLERETQKLYLLNSDNRDDYASNIVIIEVSDINAEFQSMESANTLIVQSIGPGLFSEKEFVIKDYEDNKLVYVQKR